MRSALYIILFRILFECTVAISPDLQLSSNHRPSTCRYICAVVDFREGASGRVESTTTCIRRDQRSSAMLSL